MFPTLVPQHLKNVSNFRALHGMAQQQVQNRHALPGGVDKLDKYLEFWSQFCLLIDELRAGVVPDIDQFVGSVTRMREPEKKDQIDRLVDELDRQHSETFDFREAHNERDNLYTYRLMVCDQTFLGLVGYIPHLISYCTKICFHIKKLYLEKEWYGK